jgi:hypothetical protein
VLSEVEHDESGLPPAGRSVAAPEPIVPGGITRHDFLHLRDWRPFPSMTDEGLLGHCHWTVRMADEEERVGCRAGLTDDLEHR